MGNKSIPEPGQARRKDFSKLFCVPVESRRGIAKAVPRVFYVVTSCLLSMSLVGCGGDSNSNVVHWSGEITLDGKPLPSDCVGSITFRPMTSSGGQAVTVRIENGHYDSPQTPKGKVQAFFDIERPTGRTFHSDRVDKDVPETESIVPSEHAQGMEFDVTEDKSDANIDL